MRVTAQNWEAEIELGNAAIFEARGQFKEAEASLRIAEARKRAGMKGLLSGGESADGVGIASIHRFYHAQSCTDEGPAGPFCGGRIRCTSRAVVPVEGPRQISLRDAAFHCRSCGILIEQGRHSDGEKLLRVALDIGKTTGVPDEAPQKPCRCFHSLAASSTCSARAVTPSRFYAQIDRAIANWEPMRRQVFELNGSRIASLYASGQIEAGISAADAAGQEADRTRRREPF